MIKNFFELKGQTITGCDASEGDDAISFVGVGFVAQLFHHQDCCEVVRLNKIIGKVEDILNSPITLAEEDTDEPDWHTEYHNDSHTWTKFILETVKGRVEFWFLGESNGYYGERVSFAAH